jgi:hypothetical protein
MDIEKLKGRLEGIADPRRQWGNPRHKLEDILVIGLTTLVCDGEDFEDMEAFGRERELKTFLELPHGIPDESTFFRVFKRIKPEELAGSLILLAYIRGKRLNTNFAPISVYIARN